MMMHNPLGALGIAMQIPDVLAELTGALAEHGEDPAAAAEVAAAAEAWNTAEPETRAGILMSAAWGAGQGPAPTVPEAMHPHIAEYAEGFHRYAAAIAAAYKGDAEGGSETFHGPGFPGARLPGHAGTLARSLAFDRDDLAISLGTALVLLAASRAA